MRGWRSAGVMALVLALGLGACGSPGDESTADASASSSSPSTEAVRVDECAPEPRAAERTQERTLTHDGVQREYTVHLPDDHDGSRATPVILNFHGLTSNAAQQDALSNLPKVAGEQGYIVVSPQGLVTTLPIAGGLDATYWNVAPAVNTTEVESPSLSAADDLGFVDALLDELDEELCLDPDRTYATGMSNGAAMAMALLCTSDRFAAAAPVAGANFVSDCATDDPPPVIAFHGTDDVLAPYDGGDTFGFPLGLPAAEEQMAELATTAGCDGDPDVELLGEDVERRSWPDCPPGENVTLYTVLDGGHTWPGLTTYLGADPFAGGDSTADNGLAGFSLTEILGRQTETIVATDLIIDFFDAHPS